MNQIEKAVEVLKRGGVIAYPTDTIYGLGADIFNQIAVKKVFALKGRNFNKPLSIAVADFEMIEEIAELSQNQKVLLKQLLPGPITVLLKKKKEVSNLITANSELIGIRFPSNQQAIEIVKMAKFPITATSANLTGQKEVFKAQDIKLKVDFIVNGKCQHQRASTIVDLVNQKIIRSGVGIEKVKNILNKKPPS